MPSTTISCVQLAVVEDEASNLATCLRLIDQAALSKSNLIVLPEMCNWSAGAVASPAEALAHAATIPGPWVDEIAKRAARHECYVAVGVIERAGDETFISSVVYSPAGKLVLHYQKQIPFGAQRAWASPGRTGNPVLDTPFGRVGVYICADGLVPETTRLLALQGCHLLLNTLHSGGADETFLHVPARAVENRVWVASANKVGPRERGGVGTYAGGSQIVSPFGDIVARADDYSESVVTASVDLRLAEDKHLGGDDIFEIRRPDCYGALVSPPERVAPSGPASLGVAALQPRGTGDAAVDSAVAAWRKAAWHGARLVVLPGFFPFDPVAASQQIEQTARDSQRYLARLRRTAAETATWAVTSLVERDGDGYFHTGYLIDQRGEIFGKYRQVHTPEPFRGWATAGDDLPVFRTPIGVIGILLGADYLVPESVRVLALKGAQIVAIAAQFRTDYERDLILPERVAENRVNIIFARRDGSAAARGSAIASAVPYPSDPHWKVRSPDVVDAGPDDPFVVWTVNLQATVDKTIGPAGCDLFQSARPEEYDLLIRAQTQRPVILRG